MRTIEFPLDKIPNLSNYTHKKHNVPTSHSQIIFYCFGRTKRKCSLIKNTPFYVLIRSSLFNQSRANKRISFLLVEKNSLEGVGVSEYDIYIYIYIYIHRTYAHTNPPKINSNEMINSYIMKFGTFLVNIFKSYESSD